MEGEFEKVDQEEILGKRLIYAAKSFNEESIRELVAQGAPVNYVDELSGNTAIFYFGVSQRWDTVQFLLDTGECDLLIRNKQGRLLSTRIGEETGNMEWVGKIMDIELEQGRKVGIVPRIRGNDEIDPFPDID